jgi:hypothetical protein
MVAVALVVCFNHFLIPFSFDAPLTVAYALIMFFGCYSFWLLFFCTSDHNFEMLDIV